MKGAFIEWLCECRQSRVFRIVAHLLGHRCSGMFRVGEGARKMGDPYEGSVTFKETGCGMIELMGFNNLREGEPDMPFHPSHVRPIDRAAAREGLKVDWRRVHSGNERHRIKALGQETLRSPYDDQENPAQRGNGRAAQALCGNQSRH